MKEVLLSVKNLEKTFTEQAKKNKVINNISVDIYENDFTIIMGTSGAGKSTLLYALSGMDKATSGSIIYDEKDISKYNEKQMARLRTKDFGFVFQQTHLVSNLTLFENVIVAGYLNDNNTPKQVKEKAEELLEKMNVADAKNRLPVHSSGGEMQRAAIARAMINNPKIIFADEPTGSLNKNNTIEVLDLLTKLNNEGQSILMVTHDIRAAARGNRLLYLEDGKIIGEKNLPKYEESNLKQREDEINEWLSSIGW